ncbi:unnamed protein product [Ixodes hexagonus]
MKPASHIFFVLRTINFKSTRGISSSCALTSRGCTLLPPCRGQSSATAAACSWRPERTVPRTLAEYQYMKSLMPVQPKNPRLLRVAIVGEPNVGKSTLINSLMSWKVCSVSKKVHTTRHNAKAVFVDGDTQIVFLDTPGIVDLEHSRKHQLGATMVVDPEHALLNADTVGVMIDASDHWRRHRIEENLLRLLKFNENKESFLIINKVDLLRSKRQLLECIHALTEGVVGGVPTHRQKPRKPKLNADELFAKAEAKLKNQGTKRDEAQDSPQQSSTEEHKGWPNFSRVFMISALDDDGVADVRNYLLRAAQPKDWMYPKELVTDQNPHEIATMIVREKILNHLSKEVPYNLDVSVTMWDVDSSGVLHAVITIQGHQDRYMKYTIGDKGKTIQTIAAESRQDLASIFRCDVSLKLVVNKV